MQKWDRSLSVFVYNNTVYWLSQPGSCEVKWPEWVIMVKHNVMKWGKDKEQSVESWSDDLSSVIS